MPRFLRILLPPVILLVSLGIAYTLIANGPEAERQRPQTPLPVVEVLTVQPQPYQVEIPSRGTVAPLTESSLAAEVSGRIVAVGDNFRNGGFFEAGETLLQIDPRDYQNAVTVARSELTLKELALAEEEARSRQARLDWKKLNLTGEPDPLVLRTPQRAYAEAALEAARANLAQAELKLERTRISAPYPGRILEKHVDRGQYVSAGTTLADIYASDAVEVRLPLGNEQLRYLQLPEEYRDATTTGFVPVKFSVRNGDRDDYWDGELIRTEGTLDIKTRQLFVVARIADPYRHKGERPPLKIGQFVAARIVGDTLDNVYVIPRAAIHGDYTVHMIGTDNRLMRRDLEILWRDTNHVIAAGPLEAGERISLTRLPFAADGIEVQIKGEEPPQKKTGKQGQGSKS
ncbi:MAG: efflux transporter periplasmic adaptor subunit [Desulfuromonas sp.]|nr:MAG: efflux transporter periplasmic adaptor subunit [Desulfuromonas sp.]